MIFDQAIFVFLAMVRSMFVPHLNMQMSCVMMNGILFPNGFPALSVPVARQSEFKKLLILFCKFNDMNATNEFLRSCLKPTIITIMNGSKY